MTARYKLLMELPFIDVVKAGAGPGWGERMTNIRSSDVDLINPVRLPSAGVTSGRSKISVNKCRMHRLM